MIAKTTTCTVIGIDAHTVDVEVDIAEGLPAFSVIGLPDAAIRESKDRIKFAIKNSGYIFPRGKITVNLAPATIKKGGSGYDLPIAISILFDTGIVRQEQLLQFAVCGELSLDGKLKEIRGALPISIGLREKGVRKLVLPKRNFKEVSSIDNIQICTFDTLRDVVSFVNDPLQKEHTTISTAHAVHPQTTYKVDFSDVKGQEHVKRGLEIAAAGGHNVLKMWTQ